MPEDHNQAIPAWWSRFCPELRYFKSRGELRAAQRAFNSKAFAGRGFWFILLMLGAAAGGLGVPFLSWLQSFGLSGWLSGSINMTASMLFGAAVGLFCWIRPYSRFLRRYLQERGVAVCLKCGYDLRGQNQPRCPECGCAFDPKLLTPEE